MTNQASEARSADLGTHTSDFLEQSERALEEGDLAWCAVLQDLLITRVERELPFVA